MLGKIMWHLICKFFFLIKIFENLKHWLVLLSLIFKKIQGTKGSLSFEKN